MEHHPLPKSRACANSLCSLIYPPKDTKHLSEVMLYGQAVTYVSHYQPSWGSYSVLADLCTDQVSALSCWFSDRLPWRPEFFASFFLKSLLHQCYHAVGTGQVGVPGRDQMSSSANGSGMKLHSHAITLSDSLALQAAIDRNNCKMTRIKNSRSSSLRRRSRAPEEEWPEDGLSSKRACLDADSDSDSTVNVDSLTRGRRRTRTCD